MSSEMPNKQWILANIITIIIINTILVFFYWVVMIMLSQLYTDLHETLSPR